MKQITAIIAMLTLLTSAYAAHLSDFPDSFIENGSFDGVIVVGNQAPASDVIAQSNLVQYLVGYTGKSLVGSTKLSGEISNLNQNIISIGSPCHNPISAQIMNNPQPCNKELQEGKGFIKLFKYDGYYHMVIAGYSDKDARQAVTDLINGNIASYEIIADSSLNKPKEAIQISQEPQASKPAIDTEKEKIAEDLSKQLSQKISEKAQEEIQQPKEADPVVKEAKKLNVSVNQAEEKEINPNPVRKIINWFFSLFKK